MPISQPKTTQKVIQTEISDNNTTTTQQTRNPWKYTSKSWKVSWKIDV